MMTRLPGVAKQHPPDTFSVLAYAGAAVAFVGQEVTSRMNLSANGTLGWLFNDPGSAS